MSERHSGIDHVNIFWENQWALWAFSRQGTTTANSDPNKLWKQLVSDYFLPKQNDINQEKVDKNTFNLLELFGIFEGLKYVKGI